MAGSGPRDLSLTFREDYHIVIPVTLDGHPFKISCRDTSSAPDSLKPNTRLASSPLVRATDAPLSTMVEGKKRFMHVFDSLAFEGVAVGKPAPEIFPNVIGLQDANNAQHTGSLIKRQDDRDSTDPAIIIGMNVLSKLHLYIAFNERKLYIGPASPPPARRSLHN